jgi:hypothetical protein
MNKSVQPESPLRTDKPAFLQTEVDFYCHSLVHDPCDFGRQRAW